MTQDQYPDHQGFQKIVDSIVEQIGVDQIEMKWWPPGTDSCEKPPPTEENERGEKVHKLTREELAKGLAEHHNNGRYKRDGKQKHTNAEFLGGFQVTPTEIENALIYPNSYGTESEPTAGWEQWKGDAIGFWYGIVCQENMPPRWKRWSSNATWYPPVEKQAEPREYEIEPPSHNLDIPYGFQKVDFLNEDGSINRFGWNQSHPQVKYVWGWDPKNEGNRNGKIGTHVGYPFTLDGVNCLVWITPREAFFECDTRPKGAVNRVRTSTGLWGYGQWVIQIVRWKLRIKGSQTHTYTTYSGDSSSFAKNWNGEFELRPRGMTWKNPPYPRSAVREDWEGSTYWEGNGEIKAFYKWASPWLSNGSGEEIFTYSGPDSSPPPNWGPDQAQFYVKGSGSGEAPGQPGHYLLAWPAPEISNLSPSVEDQFFDLHLPAIEQVIKDDDLPQVFTFPPSLDVTDVDEVGGEYSWAPGHEPSQSWLGGNVSSSSGTLSWTLEPVLAEGF